MIMMADKQYVFREGQHIQSSHASTVAVLPSGVLIAAWFAGSYEKSSDTAIWMAVRKQGDSWSTPHKVADEEDIAHWNPVLYAQGGSLVLFYKVGHEITDWHTRIMRAEDGGQTWTAARELVPGDMGGLGTVRNKTVPMNLSVYVGADHWIAKDLIQPAYPAIVSQGQNLYISYTWKRDRVAFWKLNVQTCE